MYTLEQLRDKNLNELKEIGWQLNVLPAGDRRCRQNWIDAIAGVNSPLLELLEVSPGVEVEPVQEAIEVQASEPIESKFGRIVHPKVSVKPIAQAAETSPGVDRPIENFTEVDQPPNRGDSGRGRLESAMAFRPASYGLTGKTSTAHQLLELFKSSAHIIEDSPAAETEAEMLESAMAFRPASYGSAAKNLLDAEADDRNPILTGVTFSDRFLARYSPPQPENIHYQADANGQLSLLDFEVESVDEPPDPDDFECMFAFWAAYDAWCERTDDDSEHCEFSSEHYDPLPVLLTSLDSMCEWAPCPLEWYEPETIETVSCTLEISPLPIASSSTCNFLIPTFDAWCDRPNGKDEPPTAGVGARLPKPKPPSFPPMAFKTTDKRCPCGVVMAYQCDGTTVTHTYPDGVVLVPCYKNDLVGAFCDDRLGARASPGGDAM